MSDKETPLLKPVWKLDTDEAGRLVTKCANPNTFTTLGMSPRRNAGVKGKGYIDLLAGVTLI